MAIDITTSVDVQTLTPFKKFIMTIGALPTSYLESMTYAELLMWFCNYLQNTVIPTVNNNGEAVEELQQLYEELRTYVSDYFDNLDVQTEINNKLDDMAESGQLAEIIEDYATIPQLTSRVENLEEDNLTELVVVGDSYTALSESNWAELVASQLHLTLHKHATASMGYVTAVGGNTFIDSLHWGETQTTKLHTKYVICYGGCNDISADKDAVKTAVKAFCTEAKSQYPNATIIIVGPQMTANNWDSQNNLYLYNAIQSGALESGVAYANAQKWLINTTESYTDLYAADLTHPSALGYKVIASKMISLITGDNIDNPFIRIVPGEDYLSNSRIRSTTDGTKTHIVWKITGVTLANNSTVTLGTVSTNCLPFINNEDPLFIYGYDSTYNFYTKFLGCARVNQDGRILAVNSSGTNYTGTIIIIADIYCSLTKQIV